MAGKGREWQKDPIGVPLALQEEEAAATALYENPGGATRSHRAAAFHLVPSAGLLRIANRFGAGAVVHGEKNWMNSLAEESDAAEFCKDVYNHMQEHALKMADGLEPEDDHLGAIGWAVTVLAQAEAIFGKPWTQLGQPEAEQGSEA